MSDAGSQHHDRLHMPETPSKPHRVASLKGFLPLVEDTSLSTRGQHLPGLIASSSSPIGASKSSSNVAAMKGWQARRRRSSLGDSDAPARRSTESDRPRFQAESPTTHLNAQVDAEVQRRLSGVLGWGGGDEADERRMSMAANVLMTPQMRSQRLIGNSNPRYRWDRYWRTEEELQHMPTKIRKYYERNNYLIQHYMYIDRLLDSSLPHHLIQEYHSTNPPKGHNFSPSDVPATISEEPTPSQSPQLTGKTPRQGSIDYPALTNGTANGTPNDGIQKVKRTPRDIYRHKESTHDEGNDESTPLLRRTTSQGDEEAQLLLPDIEEEEEEASSSSRIVTVAIWINFVANLVLLIMKIVVAALTSSVSVLASLVDAALDFLSTAIIWTSKYLIENTDQYGYPAGRRRLEPVGVLVFSVIMITAFFQVLLEGVQKLFGADRTIVSLTIPAIVIMASTVVIKFLCWLWCRLVKNSSVQALAQDAMTDVVFNTFSIIFPLVGFYTEIWWLDPLGGVILSLYVILNWSSTSSTHIRNLTGCAATADERNVLLYLTMRFAKTIKQIQGLQAYHSGDKLNVEVDCVLDEGTSLRDSHDLGESLQYVLESVPNVDRAFVHLDYASYNLPSHLQQDS
ncbi:hypothetical protein KC340_g1033 [Hortaea werneckii]|nr:hypothetical protein KC342_g7740 [Hortaea werneckii]KAI7107518.1 hypothetical protein KC339_g2275 [Hortaea werneckii]KAI7227377.1 hypothetical protein KC365_g8939 [Hortaea werneckii]KAI7338141.1 hypothetical protein KC340_g1033 [Hortaea werneckii]KAI7377506.1 hypothetical protein KC328_g14387 [Hortaea werneckii]